ncbi:NADP-dependent oxidoreductase [Streptomyces chartreusis]|uniref:NADP-dependent oxidoreductase n=1 Tax=Streptomyces chartreusis TaxID=1969 RepID=UPI003810B53F
MISREIYLSSRPNGKPTLQDFGIRATEIPEVSAGQVVIRNLFLSVDPGWRLLFNDEGIYDEQLLASHHVTPPVLGLGDCIPGFTLGEVIASRNQKFPLGAIVIHQQGWQEYSHLDDATKFAPMATIDPHCSLPLSYYLGPLGQNGFTAWLGLLDIGNIKESDTVFISAASGATGHLAGQIAKLCGAARVIGSTSAASNASKLREIGFDVVIDRRGGNIASKLSSAAPDGIDLYFDGVGGEHLAAALRCLKPGGRAILSGAITSYNDPRPHRELIGVPELPVIMKGLTIRGFRVFENMHHWEAFAKEMTKWLSSNEIQAEETVYHNITSAPQAFVDLFTDGAKFGKSIVKL